MIVKRNDKTRKRLVYDVRLRNEHGKMQYYPFGHTSKTLAKEYQEKLRNQIREWRAFPERKIKPATFEEFVNKKFLPDYARRLSRERDYRSMCKKLVRKFGNMNMESIDMGDIEAYLTIRYTQVSPYMANREFYCLMAIFTKAQNWGYRTKGTNPCKRKTKRETDGISLNKEEPRFRTFSVKEIEKLLEACMAGAGTFIKEDFEEI